MNNQSTVTANPRTIQVVLCNQDKKAIITTITPDLASMQSIVQGLIEFYPIEDDFFICCNEEGKISGEFSPNRVLKDDNGNIVEVIFGNFFIAKYDNSIDSEDGIQGLTDYEAEYLRKKYLYPDYVYMFEGKIVAIPYTEAEEA